MANLEIMGIENAQNVIANTKDVAIKNHIQSATEIALRIDKDTLGLAYHIYACKSLLEGNTSGYPTDHKEFAQKVLGVQKAQYYNIMQAGALTNAFYDANGKNPVYVDAITYAITIKELFNGVAPQGYNETLYKALKRKKVFTTTKLLTIVRAVSERKEKGMEIAYSELTALSPSMTVKEIKRYFSDNYAITAKETAETTETAETAETTNTTETAETTETTETPETAKDVTIPLTIAKNAYPALARFAEESPEIASLLHYLSGYAEVVN